MKEKKKLYRLLYYKRKKGHAQNPMTVFFYFIIRIHMFVLGKMEILYLQDLKI